MPTKNANVFTFFVALTIIVYFTSAAFAENVKDEKMTGGKIDKVDVIYATDGYMVDSNGVSKYFIFGAVKLHKKGAPETEWTAPILYFEFDNKRNLAGNWHGDFYPDVPRVKRFYALATDYNYARYNESEYATMGLSEGATPHEFELDFIFDKNGEIDIKKSSMGIVPREYQTGRWIRSLEPTGEYYKKGNKTEKAVVIRDENKKIINMEELGGPVEIEGTARVSDVCYDYYSQFFPTPTPTPRDEKKPLHVNPNNDPNITPPPAPDITPSLYSDPKETPIKPSIEDVNIAKPYKSTGLCYIFKIQNISRSAGLPDLETMGLIKRFPKP